MKYGYTVKKDGVLYPAGTGVPAGTPDMKEENKTTKGFLDVEDLKSYAPDALKELATKLGVGFTEETTHEELAELCSKVEVDISVSEGNEKKCKKSDISRMNVENLKKLAAELGIDGAEESTGEVLKAAIIEKLGL